MPVPPDDIPQVRLADLIEPPFAGQIARYLVPSTAIRTVSGRYLDLIDPHPDDLLLDDIACGLGRECRFGNQIRRHYSVAEHSCRMALAAQRLGYSRDHQVLCLFHDAPEAYIGDATRPFKGLLGRAYRDVERRLMDAIWRKFGPDVSSERLRELWRDVTAIDNAILHQERVELGMVDGGEWVGERDQFSLGPACPQICCWDYDVAELSWRREVAVLSCGEVGR